MKKKILCILVIVLMAASLAGAKDLRAVKLKRFLDRYSWSPLRGHEQEILYCADMFGIDYRLYIAIAGAESTFGKRYPRLRSNLTGYLNGASKFSSIFHNIYETSKLIGTKGYYKKYRASKDIRDLVVVYKSVPPFDHYIRNIRYALDEISAINIGDAKRRELRLAIMEYSDFSNAKMLEGMLRPLFAWHAIRYDKFSANRNIMVDYNTILKQSPDSVGPDISDDTYFFYTPASQTLREQQRNPRS